MDGGRRIYLAHDEFMKCFSIGGHPEIDGCRRAIGHPRSATQNSIESARIELYDWKRANPESVIAPEGPKMGI